MPRLAGRLRSPGVLRQAPVDTLEQIAKLGRRDRHHAIRRRRPDEAAAFQPLRIKTHALTVTEARKLAERVRELERLLGRKTLEVEILKEALDLARAKKPTLLSRSPVPGDSL